MLSRVHRAVLVVVLLTAAIGSLGLTSPASAAAVPKVGQCHQLSLGQMDADADTKAPVRCSARHDLVTVAVATSPTTLAGTTLEQRQTLGMRLCLPLLDKALGRTAAKRALSAYTLIYFSPSTEQIASGARWFRCDVALEAGTRMARLPRRLHRPILPRRLTDDVRLCLTAGHVDTTCSRSHAFRPFRTFRVASSTYPTSDQFLSAAARACGRDWDWARWPGENAWAAGERNVVCFRRTRK